MHIPMYACLQMQNLLRAIGQQLSFWTLVLESLSSVKIFLGPCLPWEATANRVPHGAGTDAAMLVTGHC